MIAGSNSHPQATETGRLDIGKFAIAKEFRTRPTRLLVPIFKAAIESAIIHEAAYVLAFCPNRLAAGYKHLGCPSSKIPELPLTERYKRNRAMTEPYFEHDEIHPRLFSLRRALLGMDLELPTFLRNEHPALPLSPHQSFYAS